MPELNSLLQVTSPLVSPEWSSKTLRGPLCSAPGWSAGCCLTGHWTPAAPLEVRPSGPESRPAGRQGTRMPHGPGPAPCTVALTSPTEVKSGWGPSTEQTSTFGEGRRHRPTRTKGATAQPATLPPPTPPPKSTQLTRHQAFRNLTHPHVEGRLAHGYTCWGLQRGGGGGSVPMGA